MTISREKPGKVKVIKPKKHCWRCGFGLLKSEEKLGYCKVCKDKEYKRVLLLFRG